MTRFNLNQKIGDIVAQEPRAMDIFKKYRIDFCCGGNRPLAEAIHEQQLDPDEILNRLEAIGSDQKSESRDFREMSNSELVDYIVRTHHHFLNQILPELSELTTKILRVHCRNHGDTLFKVHSLFHRLKTDLEQHLIKEEEILFPLMKGIEKNSEISSLVYRYIAETEEEHELAGKILKELRQITADYRPPADACATYRLTFQKLEELETDLFQHIHLENNILLKRPVA
ncbi:regulator of cell morphogenesis and NO signaling [Hydrogenispora ethanolica]|uniref:Regulator of cell morphogenesis and NO signaling n=1 Tax=Hydrogenispora ethanolica TaxID=1082276 RepID=A0A4R1QV61_HYDET|nr:iron-sulfur cluster repair di-iron protein [Hydrogenispora ethanolica]TCL56455.1 regulator of cell morphogenesis and NO signaling [Hydrogenispora ethanolica]